MTVRIRVAILTTVAAVATVAVAATGLGSSAMARIGGVGVPASAAVHPTYVDVTGQYRSDDGWGVARGLIPAAPVPTSDTRRATGLSALARNAAPRGGTTVVAGPAAVSGSSSLRSLELARAGLLPSPGCSGAACGTDGCGFLAPGCALLDCGLLNPACGLGVPVSACGIVDPTCGFGFGNCGFSGSRCGFGLGNEEDSFDRRLSFGDLFDRHLFGRRFDHRFHHHDDRR